MSGSSEEGEPIVPFGKMLLTLIKRASSPLGSKRNRFRYSSNNCSVLEGGYGVVPCLFERIFLAGLWTSTSNHHRLDISLNTSKDRSHKSEYTEKKDHTSHDVWLPLEDATWQPELELLLKLPRKKNVQFAHLPRLPQSTFFKFWLSISIDHHSDEKRTKSPTNNA